MPLKDYILNQNYDSPECIGYEPIKREHLEGYVNKNDKKTT